MYAILRFQKKTSGKLLNTQKHNERQKTEYKSNPDIDQTRTAENYHLKNPAPDGYKKEISRLIERAGCRTRKDSIVAVETLITASPEFLDELDKDDQREFFTLAYDFLKEEVGEQNILSAIVHMDEKTPHMHLCFCPITKDNHLSAKTILGNQKTLSEWQTKFHAHMSRHYTELERGKSAMETKRKHIPVWLFKQSARLDEMYGKVVSLLNDTSWIGKKERHKSAIDLLAEFIPKADYFAAEVKKTEAYAEQMKKKAENSYGAADRVRVSYSGKLVEKDNEIEDLTEELKAKKQTIRKLELQAQRNERVLSLIPDDIMQEIMYEINQSKYRRSER